MPYPTPEYLEERYGKFVARQMGNEFAHARMLVDARRLLDELEAESAAEVQELAEDLYGPPLVRIGQGEYAKDYRPARSTGGAQRFWTRLRAALAGWWKRNVVADAPRE